MKKQSRSLRGFTLVEMMVVILIIVVLAGLVFVVVGRAKESAQRSVSAGNLRQFGVGITSFVADNAGYLPASRTGSHYWPQIVWPYIENLDVFLRPSTPNRAVDMAAGKDGYFAMADNSAMTPQKVPIRWNYIINGGHPKSPFAEVGSDGKALPNIKNGISQPMMKLTDPSKTVMMTEGNKDWWINGNGIKRIRTWSNRSANVLWCDGSLQNLFPKTDLRPEHFNAF